MRINKNALNAKLLNPRNSFVGIIIDNAMESDPLIISQYDKKTTINLLKSMIESLENNSNAVDLINDKNISDEDIDLLVSGSLITDALGIINKKDD